MKYLNWSGLFETDSWGDTGSPGDPPIRSMGGQVQGITNYETIWGDELDVYRILGTAVADLVYLDRASYATPRLVNITRIDGGGGNDLLDLTSARFKYGPVTLTGGTGNDWLLGNSGGDHLLGMSGNDWLKGYGGNDHLNGGTRNDHLYGGRGNDKLIGGSGNDYMAGQFGKDILTGGSGFDRFVFDVSTKSAGVDKITDFSVKYDTVELARSVFSKVGPKGVLKEKALWIGSSAHDADDRVIYNSKNGYLFYDPDGTGGASQKLIASLSKDLLMTHKDFFIA